MSNLLKDLFITLSNNKLLNKGAQRWGFQFGAKQFVAGTDVDSVLESVKKLNRQRITTTVDHLGEFITDRSKSIRAKETILELIEKIKTQNVNCHISVKLTQLGLDIDYEFCLKNMHDIVRLANKYGIFVNIDTEDYAHYDQTFKILNQLRKDHDNIGIVIQTYLYRAEDDMNQLENIRLRIVKGAYQESERVAFQKKHDIDENFLKLAKKRLKGNTFTSIATHDHHIINELKKFIEKENIDRDNFEFQMLYGFRLDMQQSLVNEGYLFCTYVPFGRDWYGYFMRRLAERPQNIKLILKDKLYSTDNKMKKTPIIVSSVIIASISYLIFKRKK